MSKKYLVADILHYPISYTEIERAVIATPLFNRLHSVKQNSTTFLTYPSLAHSRFSHSLGAMHLVGQLFFFGICNAKDDARIRFLKSIAKILSDLGAGFKADEFPKITGTGFTATEISNGIRKPKEIITHGPALAEWIPHSLSETEQYCYLVALQAIRLCALTHDLGHPPFSHVTEDALHELKRRLPLLAEPTPKQQACMNALTGAEQLPLHEQLTKALFTQLIGEVRRQTIAGFNAFDQRGEVKSAWLCTELARHIFERQKAESAGRSDGRVINALYRLISGDLDCDRLDYVQRDLILSGICSDAFRPQRLIELHELCYVNDEPCFLPSIRAIRSLEDFFSSRYDLYKHVLFHHHVVRTNGLLQEVIVDLANDWLKSPNEQIPLEEDNPNARILSNQPADISWLWRVFEKLENFSRDIRYDIYLQWDDHWLMSLLRARYVELHSKSHQHTLTLPESILLKRLEDIVASTKNYVSLVKRSEDFIDIDAAFGEELLRRSEIGDIKAALCCAAQGVGSQPLMATIESFIVRLSSCGRSPFQERRRANGLFTMASGIHTATTYEEHQSTSMLETVREQFRNAHSLRDVLFVDKSERMRSVGFDESFNLRTSSGVAPFSHFSNLARELLARGENAPGFFAFILPASSTPVDKHTLRTQLGTQLAIQFFSQIKKQKQIEGENNDA